jgi:hypothetical protein
MDVNCTAPFSRDAFFVSSYFWPRDHLFARSQYQAVLQIKLPAVYYAILNSCTLAAITHTDEKVAKCRSAGNVSLHALA